MKIKYMLYDTEQNINTNHFNIEEFEFTKKTSLGEFKRELLKNYCKDAEEMLSFKIVTTKDSYYIEFDNLKCNFLKFLSPINIDNVLIIVPCLPTGVTVARYDNYRIVIHSNEEIHRNEPHVHIIKHDGGNTRISLLDLKVLDEEILPRKVYKKVYDYLSKNKSDLIKLYNEIVSHKEVLNVTLDIYIK